MIVSGDLPNTQLKARRFTSVLRQVLQRLHLHPLHTSQEGDNCSLRPMEKCRSSTQTGPFQSATPGTELYTPKRIIWFMTRPTSLTPSSTRNTKRHGVAIVTLALISNAAASSTNTLSTLAKS